MFEVFAQCDPESFGTMVWNVVFTTTFFNDRLNLSKMPMIDGRKEMMFDLKVQASSRKEPEQRVGSKSVARRDLMFVPIERAFLSIYVLIGNMVQLTGDGEGDTEYRVWKNAPDDGFEPTEARHEERPDEDHGEG